MAQTEETKKIERRAKSMLMTRDIPKGKMTAVRSLMNNDSLSAAERYRAIIDLIESCPEKKVKFFDSPQKVEVKKEAAQTKSKKTLPPPPPELFAPTETSYYIESIQKKYRHLKLLKKRYFVHRNNRWGIGIRKRLIPSRRMIKLFESISQYQEKILERLSVILVDILNDRGIDDPTEFNYLRKVRKWLVEPLMGGKGYDSLKWMERHQFERELKNFTITFYSFLQLTADSREKIIFAVEKKLRELDELKKEEIKNDDPEQLKREKERKNLAKEKRIYEYMMLLRSFLPSDQKEDSLLSKTLKFHYSLNGLAELLFLLQESLVFQRPVQNKDIINYYQILAPQVSVKEWDYSEEQLRKLGKDAESRKKKMKDSLRKELEPYEFLASMLKYDENGENILLRAAEDQWKYIDKKHYDSKNIYNENFFSFLDALIQYFKNALLPILNGSPLLFRDRTRMEYEGAIFSFNYFESDLNSLNSVMDEMHFFKSSNPTLAISREEARRIINESDSGMAHAGSFIRAAGDCFYFIGKELQRVFLLHRRWIMNGAVLGEEEIIRTPLNNRGIDPEDEKNTRPIPFYDCTIRGVQETNNLTKEILGKSILNDSLQGGMFIYIIAFCYQISFECLNERLKHDLEERKKLMRAIDTAVE